MLNADSHAQLTENKTTAKFNVTINALLHLPDTFIQSHLHCIQFTYISLYLSVFAFSGN